MPVISVRLFEFVEFAQEKCSGKSEHLTAVAFVEQSITVVMVQEAQGETDLNMLVGATKRLASNVYLYQKWWVMKFRQL